MTDDAHARALNALGHPSRQEIVEILREGPASVAAIARRLPVTRPAVSKHLKVLADAGLVTHDEVGTRHLYRLDPEGLEDVRAYMERVWGDALRRFQLAADNLEEE